MLTDILAADTGQTREARFTEFVERQSRFVYKVAWAILRNTHDAEDIVQETFLKLYRNHGWEGLNDERAFLARAAWRLAVDRVRTRGKTASPVADSPDPARSAEHTLIHNNRTDAIHRMIDSLPEDLRQPLALSAIDELTSPQIGAIMGIPEGTVRTRIMRARQMLKEKLRHE